MSSVSLLLNAPIPRESIELGRFVLDPKYPTEDFCQPSLSQASENALGKVTPSFTVTSSFKEFSEVIERTRGSGLGLTLVEMLSLAPSFSKSTSTNISSSTLVTQELKDAQGYFSAVCSEAPVRKWLEENLRRPFNSVHLISGLRILSDARIEGEHSTDTKFEVSATAPASLVAAAGGLPLPLPGVDAASASVTTTSGSKGKVGYTASGQYVFAVAYRKIRFSLFSTRKVDEAYVQRGNRWKSTLVFRGAEDEDGVDVDIAGPLDSEGLLGHYESVDLDGEQFLYRVAEDDPAPEGV